MKIYLFVFVFGLISCENAIKNKVESIYLAENSIVEKPIRNNSTIINSKEDLIGMWAGEAYEAVDSLYSNKIIFSFKKIKNDVVKGDVYIDDKVLPFEAKITENDSKMSIVGLKNIGGEKSIKNYKLEIQKGTKNLKGSLFIKNYDADIAEYTIVLEKKIFQYNIDDMIEIMYYDGNKKGIGYRENDLVEEILFVDTIREKTTKEKEKIEIKPSRIESEGYFATTKDIFKINPSKELLKKEIVENLSKADLYILNKLIYAKHGKIFNEKKLREYFLNHSWYLPVSNNVDSDLTEIEKKNIDLLQRYEQNAKVYYKVFGR
jgi:hypothetical protein